MILLGLLACVALFTATWLHRGGRAIVSRDSVQYWEIGRNVAEGDGFSYDGEPTRMRQPLYPLLIAASITLFGDRTLPVQIMQVAMALGIVLVAAGIAREAFGVTAAGFTGLIAGLYYPFPVLATEVRTESLYVLLVSLALLFWVRAFRGSRLSDAAICGAFLALAVLTRSVAIIFIPLVPAALWWQLGRGRRGTLSTVSTFAVACALLLPWAVRNHLALGEFSVMSNAGPATLYCGLHPMALTHWEDYMTAIEQTEEYRRLRGSDDYLDPEAGARFRGAAIERALRNPLRTLGQCIVKVPLAWSYAPGSRPLLERSALAFRLLQVPQVVFLALMVAGLTRAPVQMRWTALVLFVGVSLTIFLGTPTARYTVPFMPLGLVLAAIPVTNWLNRRLNAAETDTVNEDTGSR